MTAQQPLMIEGSDQFAAFGQLSDPVKTNGINPFENVSPLPMPRGMAMLFNEALDVLETRDDPFLLRRARPDPLGFDFNAKFSQKRIIIVSEISHLQLEPSCGQGMRRLLPYAFPTRPSR